MAYPNWGGYDPPQWLDGAENLAKTLFWKDPPEAFAAILADGDFPSNQRMLRGYSICRGVGYMGVVLWEAPLGHTLWSLAGAKAERRLRLLLLQVL